MNKVQQEHKSVPFWGEKHLDAPPCHFKAFVWSTVFQFCPWENLSPVLELTTSSLYHEITQ